MSFRDTVKGMKTEMRLKGIKPHKIILAFGPFPIDFVSDYDSFSVLMKICSINLYVGIRDDQLIIEYEGYDRLTSRKSVFKYSFNLKQFY